MGASGSGQPRLNLGGAGGRRCVKDLSPGESVAGAQYAVRSKRLVEFRNKPGQYLSLVLGDRTGDIAGRVWDNAEALAERFEEGDLVAVTGRVETYQDQAQLIIADLVKCPSDQVRPEDFLPQAERSPDEMLQELVKVCKAVRDSGLRKLLASFFADAEFADKFKTCPGAKMIHHAYIGGLIEHTLNVVKICDNVCGIYPQLDRDLLIAGALLHDIGKVREYSYDTSIETTDEGNLIGHIANGHQMVQEAMAKIPELSPGVRLQVAHLVVTHHGEPEMGAPKAPMTKEACALHYAENLDAQVNRFLSIMARETGRGRNWTEYDRLLKRRLFVGEADADGERPATED
ncbi:MAG: HD domain-containing protein [Armatimonadota bacterium]|nr:MAG: HD domain-containing protein [Armatimonadota bacterium]